MKRTYYIFTAGRLARKQNTIFFEPYSNDDTDRRTDNNTNGNTNSDSQNDTETLTAIAREKEQDEHKESDHAAEHKEEPSFDSSRKRVLPIEDIDSFMVFSDINFNARFLQFLAKNSIPLHLFNYYGYYSGTYYPRDYLLSGHLLVSQVTHYKSNHKRLDIAQKLVAGSAANMLRNLKYYNGRAGNLEPWIRKMETLLPDVYDAPAIPDLMGLEGNLRRVYYNAFPRILGDKYDFDKRVKNPPDNAVNTLISFGNAMVYSACLTEIYRTQLSPLISYLHEPGDRRFSLALDLAEIFKPLLADRIIFSCLNQGRIKPNDFDQDLNFCYLKESGRKTFVQAFEEKMNTTIKHRKLKRKVSYRRLIRLECYKLIKQLTGAEEYKPFKAWW